MGNIPSTEKDVQSVGTMLLHVQQPSPQIGTLPSLFTNILALKPYKISFLLTNRPEMSLTCIYKKKNLRSGRVWSKHIISKYAFQLQVHHTAHWHFIVRKERTQDGECEQNWVINNPQTVTTGLQHASISYKQGRKVEHSKKTPHTEFSFEKKLVSLFWLC